MTSVSKKLRAVMNFISVEAPAARVATTGESVELLDTSLRIVAAGQLLQIVADQLVEALAQGIGLLPGPGDKLFIDG